ncbi:MAG: peptidoglycan DL-endopeptidase CwlO [Cryptosporangiaceae bacterium]|nr:peptidoglycan DL-endopeptidase CwlO [Cryptosporangiaceae bacterium]
MESTRLSARRGLAAVSLSIAGAVALVVIPSAGPANAEPSLAESQRNLANIGVKLDAINEQFNTANAKLAASKARQSKLLADLKPFQAKADEYQRRVSALGAESYRQGRPSMLTALLGGTSPDQVVGQLSMLDQVSADKASAIKALKDAEKPVAATKKKLDDEIKVEAAQQKEKADSKKELEAELKKWQGINAGLKGRASRASTSTKSSSGGVPTYNGPVSGSAGAVVSFAKAQLGKPYVFGAAGPNSFDCSGLTLAAWARAGVSMSHSAHLQYSAFPHVSRANALPGDLMFFYGDRHHVGIFIGGNEMIHAPTQGEPVQVADISTSYWMGIANGIARP